MSKEGTVKKFYDEIGKIEMPKNIYLKYSSICKFKLNNLIGRY